MAERNEIRARALTEHLEAIEDQKAHQGRCDQVFADLKVICVAYGRGSLRARDGQDASFYDEKINPGALRLPDHAEAVVVLARLQAAKERVTETRNAAKRAGVNFADLTG